MTTHTHSTPNTHIDAGYETSQFALGVGITTAALIGIWACVCMVSALMNSGISGVVKGLLGAMGAA